MLAADVGLGAGLNGRGPHRSPPARLEAGVGDPACVPQLHKDGPTIGMHRFRHLAPGDDLRLGVAPRRIGIALRLCRNLGRLGNDQPGRSPLAIIFSGKRAWHQPRASAVARQRCHDDTVVEVEVSDKHGVEQRR